MIGVSIVKPGILAALLLALAQTPATLRPDPPHTCGDCDAWNKPHEPFRVFGNTYYVGVEGISAVLITNGGGSILLDGGLPQSAPIIDANIRRLGFRTEDIRLIVNSHAHYDHAGGIAALQRASGATVAASAAGKRALEQGEPTKDDPQYAFGREANAFPPLTKVRAVADGETLRVGDLAITAHLTPGHTPGATSWTWRSCDGPRCANVVYADSLNAVSSDGFRFTGGNGSPSLIETFRRSIAKVAALPCDVMISVHPSFGSFTNPNACKAYAKGAAARLDVRIADEAKKKGTAAR
jgi:metallo-beta-lactamase class B